MKKNYVLLFLIVTICLVGCADIEPIETCLTGQTYNFWGGLWHGIIVMFSFIGSIFSDNITVWAVNNNGPWYTFGFLLGVAFFGLVIRLSITPSKEKSQTKLV